MRVEKFNICKHYDALQRALIGWKVRVTPESEVPFNGVIARTEGNVIAAFGFIRRVEGGFGQLDGLTSNPDLPGDIRSEAIDLVVSALISKAKDMELKGLMATTTDKNTLYRSSKFGFKILPDLVIGLSLL